VSPLAQSFAAAVETLVGDGPVKLRLASAFSEHLADLAENDLPAHLLPDFEQLRAGLTRVAPAGRETRVRASVQKMSPSEAAAHAGTIFRLYVELSSALERAEPLKVVGPSSRKPPRYLTGR
jgi:hypothetical protein